MKPTAGCLVTTCVATMVAVVGSPAVAAAEGAMATQDLVNVRAAGQVTASWTRQPDYYALQVVMETSRPAPPRPVVPSNVPAAPASTTGNISPERSSFFVGGTIANLRGLDPVFGCRTLTLVDGRRVVGGQPTAPLSPGPSVTPYPYGVVQSYPPAIKHPRIEVWLLRADGAQVVPAAYTCTLLPASPDASTAFPSVSRNKSEEFSYRYSVEDGPQAVAAAIRIDNDFYIEKLQPLESNDRGDGADAPKD